MPVYLSNLYAFQGDANDYIYTAVTTTLPSSVDWRGAVHGIENQGFFNSCTANSTAAACEMIMQSNGGFLHLARLFNYYESRKHANLLGTDAGAYLRDAVSAIKKVGYPAESLWPYNTPDLEAVPPTNVYSDAATRLLDRYERIDDGLTYVYDVNLGGSATATGTSTIGNTKYITDIKSAVSEGYPVVIGLPITLQFESIVGDFAYQYTHPYVGVNGTHPSVGNHAVVIIGYDDAYNSFIILNSWGTSWGSGGYALFPYSVMTNLMEAWVLKGFMGGQKILSSSQYNPNATPVVTPNTNVTNTSTTVTYTGTVPLITTLMQGSQLLYEFSVMSWVDVLFVKGFATNATLYAKYYPAINTGGTRGSIRFWVEETSTDTKYLPNADAFFPVVTGTASTAINAYMVPVYSISGAVIILKVNITHANYLSFIQSTSSSPIEAQQNETLAFVQLTAPANAYNGIVNREVGLSLFDNSYIQAFNKRIKLPDSFTGYIHFLNSGFDKGMWVKQIKDSITGDISVAVANSLTGASTDFGTPVLIAKNTNTLSSPVYAYPPNPYTAVPDVKYGFTASSYTSVHSTTSPFPYLVAVAADGSTFVFTTIVTLINKVDLLPEAVTFDIGAHYLAMYKSGVTSTTGLGGSISSEMLLPSIMITPTKKITGIRIISTGGLTSSNLMLRQRSTGLAGSTTLSGTYPVLDINNNIYLSFADGTATDGTPSSYGDEVNVTESGTYVLHSKAGGTITIVTNRLLYNPYYNSYEQLAFNNTDSDIFASVTPNQILSGATEYQCVYIKNRHPTLTFAKISIWSDYNCNNLTPDTSSPQYLQFGYDSGVVRDGAASHNPSITNKVTAPSGITFNFVNAESSALVINDLLPNQCVPIWIKRVVQSSTTVTQQDVLSYLRMKVMY